MSGGGPKTDIVRGTTSQKQATTSANTQAGTSAGTSAVNLPPELQQLFGQIPGISLQGLQNFQQGANAWNVPQATLDAITSTAQGDFLYGGEGQQAFIDAAKRAAMPGINSQFGMAGRGGNPGLAQAALDQTAVDAYARLYQGERGMQQQAAFGLPGITMMPLELQKQLAALAGGTVGQFSPLFGRDITGETTGEETQTGTVKESGKTQQITPLHQKPLWQDALGVALLAAGPFTGGATFGPGASLLAGGGGPLGTTGGYGGGGGGGPFLTNPLTGGALFGGGGSSLGQAGMVGPGNLYPGISGGPYGAGDTPLPWLGVR